jgi:hypothetical protein
MPTIVPSSSAPSETIHYSFATAEFDLGGKTKTYKTDDPQLISSAVIHPWLQVNYDPVEVVQGSYIEQIAPEDDPLSGVGSLANDPDAARATEDAKAAARGDVTPAEATSPVATLPEGDEPAPAEDTSKSKDTK